MADRPGVLGAAPGTAPAATGAVGARAGAARSHETVDGFQDSRCGKAIDVSDGRHLAEKLTADEDDRFAENRS